MDLTEASNVITEHIRKYLNEENGPLQDTTSWRGLDIGIENKKGTTRKGSDPDGNEWESTLTADYGYFKNVAAHDGDDLDVFIGPHPEEEDQVYIVRQVTPGTDEFDEYKVLVGFTSQDEALNTYLGNYDRYDMFDGITSMDPDEFVGRIEEFLS